MAEATHASTGVPAEHAGAFPPFEASTFLSQLIWLAIAFGLLFYLMSKVALPRVAGAIHARAERISRDLDEAHALRQRSEEAGAAYERALADAQDRAKGIAQQTRDTLGAESDARRKALEAELGAKMIDAEATIRARTDEAMSNVRGIASELASSIIERLTGRVPDGAKIQAALDRTTAA